MPQGGNNAGTSLDPPPSDTQIGGPRPADFTSTDANSQTQRLRHAGASDV